MIEPVELPPAEQMDELLGKVPAKELHRILRDANHSYAYEEEFLRRTGMLTVSARTSAWVLLDFSRRATGHDIGGPVEPDQWMTITPEILRRLHEIDTLTTGHLATSLERLGDEQQRFTSHAMMDEAVAACLMPDEQTQVKNVRSFLRQGLKPKTRTERLVVNFYNTMQQVPRLAGRPLTMETVLTLQGMLSRGLCEGDECLAFRRRNIPTRTTVDLWPGSYPAPLAHEIEPLLRRQIEQLNANEPWVHPLIRGPLLYFTILSMRPFEVEQIGLARAVFQVYMHRSGYPAFQLMPISRVLLERYRDYALHWPADNGGDLTGFALWSLEGIWHALDALRVSIDAHVAEDDRLRDQLRFDTTLNHRQRTILGRAIRLPGATFFIDYHRRSYGIAYSTARADLIGLVDRGYLRVRRDGHAFVFTPVQGLRELVAARSAPGARTR